jgi:hypothetical protein
MNDLLLEFMRSGKLGEVSVGTTAQEVYRLLGASPHCGGDAVSGQEILKYDALELTMAGGSVAAIQIWCDGRSLPHPYQEVVLPAKATTIYQLLELFNAEGLFWEVCRNSTSEHQLCFIIERMVGVIFDLRRRNLRSMIFRRGLFETCG